MIKNKQTDSTFSLKTRKSGNTEPTFLHGRMARRCPSLDGAPALQFSSVPTRSYCSPVLRRRSLPLPAHSLSLTHSNSLSLRHMSLRADFQSWHERQWQWEGRATARANERKIWKKRWVSSRHFQVGFCFFF